MGAPWELPGISLGALWELVADAGMEDNDGGECDPTYIDQRTNERGVVALFSSFEIDA